MADETPEARRFNENIIFPHGAKWFFQHAGIVNGPYDTSDIAMRALIRARAEAAKQRELF